MSRSYDREVTIERQARAHDGLQKTTTAWATLAKVPARMKAAVGSERFANEQNAATAPAGFWIRYDPDLMDLAKPFSPQDRIRDELTGLVYDVKAVNWSGRRNDDVEVLATTKVG